MGFLTKRESESDFYVGFRCPIGSFFTSLLKLGIPVETEEFLLKLLLKQRILAVHHDFH